MDDTQEQQQPAVDPLAEEQTETGAGATDTDGAAAEPSTQEPPASEPEPVESLARPEAIPQLASVAEAAADLEANPGRTASLSEAGYVVRDGAL